MIITSANKIYKIIDANLLRQKLVIQSRTTGAIVYIKTFEDIEVSDYLNNGYPLENTDMALDVDGYNGSIYAVSDTAGAEIRVIEFNRQAV